MVRTRSAVGLLAAAVLALWALGPGYSVEAQSPPEPPSRFAGSVTIDGIPAPAGTPVEARIGGVSCGVTSVFQQGGESRYVIDVAGAQIQAGCGSAGATVTFLVGGVLASQVASWRNYELVQLDLALSTSTPPPAASPSTTPTPRPPAAGTGPGHPTGLSGWWIISMAALGSLGFVGVGWAASRS